MVLNYREKQRYIVLCIIAHLLLHCSAQLMVR